MVFVALAGERAETVLAGLPGHEDPGLLEVAAELAATPDLLALG